MRETSRSQSPPDAPRSSGAKANAYERSDVRVSGIVIFLAILAFGAVMIHAGLWAWLKTLREPGQIKAAADFSFQSNAVQVYPRLQVSPELDWRKYRETQAEKLTHYRWFDRTAGVVRVPIAVAMEALLKEGLPRLGSSNNVASPLELQRARATNGGVR